MSGTNATCPECGRELPEGRSASQCAHCLIGLGLEVPGDSDSEDRANLVDQPPAAGAAIPAGLTPLRRFGDYELLEEIAHGGMGVVYKARQVSLDRLVAVKMILAGEFATQAFVQRFRTEASAAAVLHHPNIVAIHEVGVHDGQHYFSMDFVDGPSLAALAGHQPLPARRAAQYLKTIAEAIHYWVRVLFTRRGADYGGLQVLNLRSGAVRTIETQTIEDRFAAHEPAQFVGQRLGRGVAPRRFLLQALQAAFWRANSSLASALRRCCSAR